MATLLLAGCAAAQTQPPEAVSQPDVTSNPAAVKPIPWLEVAGESPAELEKIVTGLELWRRVTDTAILSVGPGQSAFYPTLKRRVPGMRIIPGLKTWTLLKSFDSEPGWESIAKELARIAEAAGERTVLIENETAVRPYLEGKVDVDLAALRRGLEKLPRNLQILWYPGIHGEARLKYARSTAVCELVAATCRGARFTDTDSAGPSADQQWWVGQARTQMRKLSDGRPTLPILYTYAGQFWNPQQILRALALTGSPEAIIYTGSEHWLADTQTIVELVSPARAAPPPTALRGKP